MTELWHCLGVGKARSEFMENWKFGSVWKCAQDSEKMEFNSRRCLELKVTRKRGSYSQNSQKTRRDTGLKIWNRLWAT